MQIPAATALLLGLSLAAAQAAPHPPILPLRDVAVTYTLQSPGRADASYQVEYHTAGRLARIDDPAHGTFFLINLPTGAAQMVVPALHSMIAAPNLAGLTQQINDAGDARFTPLGGGEYAGTACNKYLVQNPQGSGSACITPDGVILYFTGADAHGAATITATAVTYGPQNPADFAPPGGFSSIKLPPAAILQLMGQQ